LKLIKSEFGVVHWLEVAVEVIPSDAHTISQMLGADDDQPQADL
jgi:hypothetical protein